jgi:hypothetical protein
VRGCCSVSEDCVGRSRHDTATPRRIQTRADHHRGQHQERHRYREQGYEESTRTFKREVDPSLAYRYVRYLPEYLWMGWSEQHASFPVEVRTSQDMVILKQPTVVNTQGMGVSVAFLLDAK